MEKCNDIIRLKRRSAVYISGYGDRTFVRWAIIKAPPFRSVGVVGLGHMGNAFVLNLVADGYRVRAYDRDPAHVEALRAAGAEGASNLVDLAACDAVLTSLPDDEALTAVALHPEGLAHVVQRGAVHISMSTVSPDLSRRLVAEHEACGQGYVAPPVLGNPDLARARHLFVLAARRPAALERTRPLLERLGQRLFVVGEDAAAANLMKWQCAHRHDPAEQGEVLALLRNGGVDLRVAFDVLTNSAFDSRVHRTYGGKIVDERYSPAGMAVPLVIKDLRLALTEPEHEAVPTPAASLVRDRLVGLAAGPNSTGLPSAYLQPRGAGLSTSFDVGHTIARQH